MPCRQRLGEHKNVRRFGTLIVVVDSFTVFGGCSDWLLSFLEQLDRLLVHPQDRTLRIVGFCICFKQLLPAGHKFGIGIRWNHPVLDFPVRHAVFFSVRRMVS